MMKHLCALAVAASVLTTVPLAHGGNGGHGNDDRSGSAFRPVATLSVPGATSAEIGVREVGRQPGIPMPSA